MVSTAKAVVAVMLADQLLEHVKEAGGFCWPSSLSIAFKAYEAIVQEEYDQAVARRREDDRLRESAPCP